MDCNQNNKIHESFLLINHWQNSVFVTRNSEVNRNISPHIRRHAAEAVTYQDILETKAINK